MKRGFIFSLLFLYLALSWFVLYEVVTALLPAAHGEWAFPALTIISGVALAAIVLSLLIYALVREAREGDRRAVREEVREARHLNSDGEFQEEVVDRFRDFLDETTAEDFVDFDKSQW